MKTALIVGITGQDGSYLARHLLSKGYRVIGTSRDPQGSPLGNLRRLGIAESVRMLSLVPDDFHSVLLAVSKAQPQEVYYLASQSSVGLSFEQPAETIKSSVLGVLNILEVCRFLGPGIKIYNASSSEVFGDILGAAATEETPLRPLSPYAVAKASAGMLVANYREAYGMFACSGILFNHESPLRNERFVTQKIANAVRRIKRGELDRLVLGRLDVSRDWGWAAEYVEAMWLMLQQGKADDYVIATGSTHSLEEFVAKAFACVGLDWRDHVESSAEFMRPQDIQCGRADPGKAERQLNWKARVGLSEIVERMVGGIV